MTGSWIQRHYARNLRVDIQNASRPMLAPTPEPQEALMGGFMLCRASMHYAETRCSSLHAVHRSRIGDHLRSPSIGFLR